MITYKTAESVCMGHPDKLCDLIADSILDACLRKDKASRVACEVMATSSSQASYRSFPRKREKLTHSAARPLSKITTLFWRPLLIIVAGEITCDGKVDIRWEVREALRKAGYNPWRFTVFVFVHKQSKDIDAGVTTALEARNGSEERYASTGAGDQGTVYGYATDETYEKLPLPLVLAHRICKRVDTVRRDKIVKGLMPDGKAQVTIEYEDGKPKRVKTIIVSVQHEADKTQEQLYSDIKQNVLWQCFEDFPFDDETEILVNPSGRFVEGGPAADTGLTGRKLMVDTYGGLALHGGGAFSGKDPTKVDRSGAYMARYIAKNIVWSGLAKECGVALSYAIGKADPVAVNVDSFGTSELTNERLSAIVQSVFNLRPAAIIEKLRLRSAIYEDTTTYGHFNSRLFPWEDTNIMLCEKLRKAAEEYADRKDCD